MTGLAQHHRQGGDQLDQRRVVVVEPERPLLPVGDAGRQVHHLVDRRVLLEQALLGQRQVNDQQPDHRQQPSRAVSIAAARARRRRLRSVARCGAGGVRAVRPSLIGTGYRCRCLGT